MSCLPGPHGYAPPCLRGWCPQAGPAPREGSPHRLPLSEGFEHLPRLRAHHWLPLRSQLRCQEQPESCIPTRTRGVAPGGQGPSSSLAAAGRRPARRPTWEMRGREGPQGRRASQCQRCQPVHPLLVGDSLAGCASGYL